VIKSTQLPPISPQVCSANGWRAVTESVIGASHVQSGLPNQDKIAVAKGKAGLIVAMSDGHGGSRYVRSDRGAGFAVTTAVGELKPFIDGTASHVISRSELESRIPQALTRRWQEAVRSDLSKSGLTDEERTKSGVAEGDELSCYGATLIAVVVTTTFLLYLQLGDGDIVEVDKSGNVFKPFLKDVSLLGNETMSLCSPEPSKNFRILSRVLDSDNRDEHPSVILVATDGYANCFKDEASLLQAGKDFHDLFLRSDGVPVIRKHLHDWLRESSDKYSGDDISVALICGPRAQTEKSIQGGGKTNGKAQSKSGTSSRRK